MLRKTKKPELDYKVCSYFCFYIYKTDQCKGYQVAQLRVIFAFPNNPDERFAYVEWFSKFSAPDPYHGMLKLNHQLTGSKDRLSSIIPISSIKCSIHLFPKFGLKVPEDWTSLNVLEKCTTFYLNQFSDRKMYHISK